MRRCFRSVLFGLLLLITFTPTIADALPYNAVVYGPLTSTNDGVQTIEVGIVAFGKYDAAMVALGYDGAFIDGLSSDVRARLSNQETGGDFWSFAQKFTLAPNDDLMTLNGITWKSLNALYGYGNVRRGVYTQGEAANAKRDLQTILDGGSLGGGGTSDTEYYYYDMTPTGWTGAKPNMFDGVAIQRNYAESLAQTARLNSDKNLSLWIAQGRDSTGSVGANSYYVVALSSEQPVISADSRHFNWVAGATMTSGYIPSGGSWSGWGKTWLEQDTVSHDGKKYIVLPCELSEVKTLPLSVQPANVTFAMTPVVAYYWGNPGGFIGPPAPPNNWPDTPEVSTPTAPEVPEPSEPDMPSQPAQPTAPTLPDFPSNVIAPGTTYETFDIQAILDAMDEHCQHIQSAVYQGFSDYFDTFTPWLRDEFTTLRTFLREEDDWIVESISDEFMELRSYLKELAEWLADQMDFTITGGDYDDSTVVSWLKKIYYKLGGASVNTKPVDPVGDPDGSWDWLTQLVEAILSALANGAAGLAGTLGDLFQGIKDKFPFSIPWDIVAIVALLDAPPVTPAAVIEYDVFGAHVRYDIDLHFFDEQASVIRAMEDVLFCAFLLFKTDWLTGIFDGIGGFLGGKLKATVKGA